MKKTLFLILTALLTHWSVAQEPTPIFGYADGVALQEREVIEDSIYIADYGPFDTYYGYLPIVVYYDTIVEWYDDYSIQPIGISSQYLTIREPCSLFAWIEEPPQIVGYISAINSYYRPEAMIPFVDTITVRPGQTRTVWGIKNNIVIPDNVYVTRWYRDEVMDSTLHLVNTYMIEGLQRGDTVNLRASVYDRKVRVSIDNYITVICPFDYGTEDNEGHLSLVYPNPTRDGQVTIKSNEGETAKVYDMTGRLVKEASLKGKETTLQLPDTPGVYLIRTGDGLQKILSL